MLAVALRTLTRRGLRRGLQGSRPWMVTAIVVIGMRALRRLANPEPEVVYRTRVTDGDRFVITSRTPGTR